MPVTKDYYDVLGVSRKATQKEIQAAFRKLARQLHPDVNPGDKDAESRFKEASEAHGVLSDPEKRKLYDRFGSDWQAAQAAGMDPDQPGRPTRGPRGSGRQYQTVDPQEFEDLLRGVRTDGGGFGDIFGSFFGRGGGARTHELDLEGVVEISLREAFQGTTRQVELADGRLIELKVPAGVQDGTVLRVPGLRARVQIGKDPTFEREGRDLRVAVPVPLRTALLGGEVEVPTLRGSQVKLSVPPETQNGTRLRLRGLGMPDAKGGKPGDLYAEVRVRLPLPLDQQARRWAEQAPG